MATYRQTLTTLQSNVVSRIYQNTTKDITGTVHQQEDLDIVNTTFANLVPIYGDAYVVVRGGATESATDNYAALSAAYALAKTMTPHGNALSASNRVAVLLMPGTYDAGAATFQLDGNFVDLIGLGDKNNVTIKSTGTSTMHRTAPIVMVKNMTIHNAGSGYAYSSDSGSGGERLEEVVFDGLSSSMQPDIVLDGIYVRCTGGSGCFRSSLEAFVDVNGTFIECTGGMYSFGGKHSGVLRRCEGGDRSFGSSYQSAVFDDCTTGLGTFGPNVPSAEYAGTYVRCSGGPSSFNGTCSGVFKDIEVDGMSFGYAANSVLSGTFVNIKAGSNCFGKGSSSVLSGKFKSITAGMLSFYPMGGTLSGTFEDCTVDGSGFGSVGSTLSGRFIRCTGGNNSFGNQCTITGFFKDCTGKDFCFGYISSNQPEAKYVNCHGDLYCFGYGGSTTYLQSTYIDCVAAGFSFGTGTNPAYTNTSKYINCRSGDYSFVAGHNIDFQGECRDCHAGDYSFCSASASAVGNVNDAAGLYINCTGGNSCFGASTGSNGGAVASGTFINCHGGLGCFGSNGGGGLGGATRGTASGYFENCSGAYTSFAGHVRGVKSGKFVRCTARTGGVVGVADDDGVLSGTMIECTWKVTGASKPALTVTEGAKVYGGTYVAGASATNGIVSDGGASINAAITGITINKPISSDITNDIASPLNVVDINAWH